jgi:protein prenyltransferase alpha subunit repeat containing protein 1
LSNDRETIEIIEFPIILDSIGDPNAPEFSPFLFVENNLGIPKKVLIKVFLAAKEEYFAILSQVGRSLGVITLSSELSIDKVGVDNASRLQCLTKVVLLFDPEHQTALNTR